MKRKKERNNGTGNMTYSVNVIGSKVTINYSLTSKATIKAMVSDSKGIIYRQQIMFIILTRLSLMYHSFVVPRTWARRSAVLLRVLR